jgi:curved DNA-binding protein CbpA
MVKADVRKDYYAELGVNPSAELEEIKKRYYKLGMGYPPTGSPNLGC